MYVLKHELKTILFIAFAAAISLVVLSQSNYKFGQHVFSAGLPALPTPTSTPVQTGSIQVTTTEAPDGLKMLTTKKQKVKDGIEYSFYTSGKLDSAKTLIFDKTENSSQNLSVPYNTWSPGNAYFFLKESTPGQDNYYVFRSSGEPFSDGSQYLNVQDFFKQKLPNYVITDVTGWADPDLLIVNTKTDQGTLGPSFWFVVSSRSFLQLGTHFY